MKKIIIVLLVAFGANLTYAFAENSEKDVQRNMISVEKKIKKLETKKVELTKKYENAKAELLKEQQKVDALKEKPKSPAYKSALKKTESLPAKVEKYALSIQDIEQQVDSLNSILVNMQENRIAAADVVSEVEDVQEVNYTEPVTVSETIKEEEPAIINATSSVIHEDVVIEEIDSSNVGQSFESGDVSLWAKIWKFIKILFWSVVGIIVLVFFGKIGSRMGNSSSHSSSSSSRSTRSNSSSISSSVQSDKEYKRQRIAEKQAEIARQQEKIARLRSSIDSRKRNRASYSDLQLSIRFCQERIASLRGDIARIKAK